MRNDEELSHGHGQFIKTWTVNTSKERTFIWTMRTDVPVKRPSPHANPGRRSGPQCRRSKTELLRKQLTSEPPAGAITSCMGASEGRNGTFRWQMNRRKNTAGQTDGARGRGGFRVGRLSCTGARPSELPQI